MSTHKVPRKARRNAPIAAGPLRNNHKAALKKIWDERPCLPSVTSRKAWAAARGIDPAFVNRWFYAQVQKARAAGFELDTENESYDLGGGGSPVGRLAPTVPPLKQNSISRSTTPRQLPELSSYEHPTSSETGLRIPLSPNQSSSPIFGSSFYSPKLTLDSRPDAYGYLLGAEQFLFTPPSPPKHGQATLSRSHSRHLAEELRIQIRQCAYPLPVSPAPNICPPSLPLAPRKPRPSRGSHDILNFRVQDDPCVRFSPPISSPTSGYSVPYRIGAREPERGDKPNPSTFLDLRTLVAKTSRPIDQMQGGCIGDDRSLNHRDDHITPPFPKGLRTISVQCVITQQVCPL